MASFTDIIPQFNPYVQQLPVEAMVQVGMEKQKRYDEGIQKIQQSIDTIAGLEVGNDVDRAYLQSKLNQLGNNLMFVAAGDFSNYQLVNSVDGMAKQLAYDPTIQTAVSSAAKRKKEIELVEEARKIGELVPDNEVFFAKRDSEWLNSTEAGKSYNARYVPYFDIFKFAKEKVDALKIDGFSFDEIYQKDANGNYVTDKQNNLVLSEAMIRVKEKGYLPGKLEATLNEVFSDGRVKQQLAISSEYEYRNTTPEQLAVSITNETNKLKNEYENRLDLLNIKLQANPNDDEIKDQIKKTELAISKLGEDLIQSGKLISQNPDTVKNYLYERKKMDNFMSIFNTKEKSEEVLDNPRWKAYFEKVKEANAQTRWAQTEQRLRYQFAADYEQKERFKKMDQQAKLAEAKAKAERDAKGLDALGGLSPEFEPNEYNVILNHSSKVSQAASDFSDSEAVLVWNSLWNTETNRSVLEKEMQRTIDGRQITQAEAIKSIIGRWAKKNNQDVDAYMTSKALQIQNQYNSPEGRSNLAKNNYPLYNMLKEYEDSKFNWGVQNDIDKKVKQDGLASFYKQMEGLQLKQKNIKIGNETFKLTKEDAINLAVIAKYEDELTINKSDWFGTDQAKMLKQLSDAAKVALIKSGKSKVLNSFLQSFPGEKKSKELATAPFATSYPFQPIVEAIEGFLFGTTQTEKEENYLRQVGSPGDLTPRPGTGPFGEVYRAMYAIDPKTLGKNIEKTAEAVQRYRTKNPNKSGSVATGDDKQDGIILQNLKEIANRYYNSKQGVGVDADEVIDEIRGMKNANDLQTANILRGIDVSAGAGPQPYIRIDDAKLYLSPTEAEDLKVNPSNIYYNEYVIAVEELINTNGGYSSYGDINDINTYRENDIAMRTKDFPQLANTKYQAKVNFLRDNKGMYYPYMYINNGKKERVMSLPVNSPDLGKLMTEDLPLYASPTVLEQLLNRQ
jgi:hypothetical protein